MVVVNFFIALLSFRFLFGGFFFLFFFGLIVVACCVSVCVCVVMCMCPRFTYGGTTRVRSYSCYHLFREIFFYRSIFPCRSSEFFFFFFVLFPFRGWGGQTEAVYLSICLCTLHTLVPSRPTQTYQTHFSRDTKKIREEKEEMVRAGTKKTKGCLGGVSLSCTDGLAVRLAFIFGGGEGGGSALWGGFF